MKRAAVVAIVLVSAVFGVPPSALASGSYGAVVEKGVRDCTTDDLTEVAICFEAPSVDLRSRGVFLQVWRAASPYFAWSHAHTGHHAGAISVPHGRDLSSRQAGGHVHRAR